MVKKVFIQTLIITIFIFATGFYFGDYIESQRADNIQELFFQTETDRLDLNTQIEMFENLDCESIRSETINLADKTYFEAISLENIKESENYNEDLNEIHRRYDLIRTIIWKIVYDYDDCFEDYDVFVYLYEYKNPSYDVELRQEYYASVTSDIKKTEERVILIPIAYDTNIISLDLLMDILNIEKGTKIVINNEIIVDDYSSKEDILELINANKGIA